MNQIEITESSRERLDKVLSFLHIFVSSLSASHTQSEIGTLIKELKALNKNDIYLAQSTKEGSMLLLEIANLARDRVFALLCAGNICSVEYLHLLLFVFDKKYIDVDTRFDVFIELAQSSLFVENNSDAENILFIELYILAKTLKYMCNFAEIIREYISFIILTDINIPISLTHAQFIVDNFESLGVDMLTLLEALKAQHSTQKYFTYKVFRRRSILNWQIHCFWNVSHFFNHNLWLELYPLWRGIFYDLLKKCDIESIDEAMYVQFFIYHMCGNNFHTQSQWRQFCDEIDKVAVGYYEKFAKSQGIYGVNSIHNAKKTKKCIAFLRDRLVANSPYKVEYSLLSNLLSDKDFKESYEIRIYDMKLLEKSADDEQIIRSYEELGIEVVDVVSVMNTKGFYNSHFQKALALKSAMNRDNVDILISPNNGYGISDFILASRSAPVQIYYSHGNFVYDLPCIDFKMTHICQNKRHIIHEGYDFYGVPVKMCERFYNPPLNEQHKEQISLCRNSLPKNVVILGSIGRLMKLHSKEYWECVVAIMNEYPKSIYLACGSGNSALISECIMSVFESSADGEAFLKRVHFMGYVDSTLYGHIIDIWLDSFPLEQGESRIEYVAKGGISLVMSKQDKHTRETMFHAIIQKWQHIPNADGSMKNKKQCEEAIDLLVNKHLPLVAFSAKDYINKGRFLLECYINGDLDSINAIKSVIAIGQKIGDEIKEREGISAFKEIVDLKWSKSLNI